MSEDNVQETVTTETPEAADGGTPTHDATQDSWLDALDPEVKKEIQKLRKEAAAKRVLSKQQEADLAELKAYKESQMTELEKAQARIAELESSTKEVARAKAALAAGLDEELVEYIRGDTADEMLESARVLAEKTKAQGPGDQTGPVLTPSALAGRRGPAVTDSTAEKKQRANDMMRALINRAR